MVSFVGGHAINLDSKGRLAIPARIREEMLVFCGGRMTVTGSSTEERCLQIYLDPDWQNLKPGLTALPLHNKAAARTKRIVLGMACETELDAAGRILIPQTLRDFAYLDKKIMLIGQGSKLEIWSEERWLSWLDEDVTEGGVPAELLSLPL